MRVYRSQLTADFVQLPNGTVRDPRLSYMARGVLAELLSRPDGWETTADDLWRAAAQARGSAAEGRRAFRAAFAELKELGYLVAARERLAGGRFGTVLRVYDLPADIRDSAGRTDVPHAGTPVPPAETHEIPGRTDVPQSGTSVRPALTNVSAARSDVPHAGTSESTADVPHAGTPVPPGQTGIPAGRTDVPLSDVPHAGTSSRKRSTNTENTPPPRARAEAFICEQLGATAEEGKRTLEEIERQHEIRTSPAGFVRALHERGQLAAALARVRAADARTAAARRDAARNGHPFTDDGNGTCQVCPLPAAHARHQVTS